MSTVLEGVRTERTDHQDQFSVTETDEDTRYYFR